MHSSNHWGGSFETMSGGSPAAGKERSQDADVDRAALSRRLDETQKSWLLGPSDHAQKKDRYVDLGCVVCKRKLFMWIVWSAVAAFFVVALPVIIVKTLPKHRSPPPPPDIYANASHKALMFFNAQKSGRLPNSNGVRWRGDSGLKDGSTLGDVKGGLVGGYYDAGDNIKFNFPMAFSMTLLSWSAIEYGHKYRAAGEYHHVRELIKWGTDYLLRTFNSSAATAAVDKIYSQVGTAQNDSNTPDDGYCWMRPEDMNYPRPVQVTTAGPDLAGEMAAALAAASIVFRDRPAYSKRLVDGAAAVYRFARDRGKRAPYSRGVPSAELFYNSTGYYDEYMWSAAWLYYATGNTSYLSLATNPSVARHAGATLGANDVAVLSWDNKLPAAELLLTRLRMFLNPGYPYEEMLRSYQKATDNNMCSYFKNFDIFNYTKGGMIQLNHGKPGNLQYVVNAAFLASLYADYMDSAGVPGFYCGPYYFSSDVLRRFATSQIEYILGDNPRKISYVVGHGRRYPRRVHHRGASIPHNGVFYSCTAGWKWRDTGRPNPNLIEGAMVGGPDQSDEFSDDRRNSSYTEPTLAGNAGLVAALVSLTSTGGRGIDRNTIFSAVRPLYPPAPPPPAPWRP